MNQAIVVAHLNDVSVRYLHKQNNSQLTLNRRVIRRTSIAIAEETVCRLHRIQAQGKHWQSVFFFDIC